MKTVALDIGDVWTGTAISDVIGMFARPYQTTKTIDLLPFLTDLFAAEPIKTVLVGHPMTLRGNKSSQTHKIEALKLKLEQEFPDMEWLLWDEQYTSQQADELKQPRNKEEKQHSHSIAAAFILSAYLDHLHFQKKLLEETD